MKGFLLLPVRILMLLLLAVVLPQVWLLGLLHGFIEGVRHPEPLPGAIPILRPHSLSEALAKAVLAAHEEQLRMGQQRWH